MAFAQKNAEASLSVNVNLIYFLEFDVKGV
jgi:hypothetical protein